MAFRRFPCRHLSDTNLATNVCMICFRVELGTDSKLSPSTKSPYVPDSMEIEEE